MTKLSAQQIAGVVKYHGRSAGGSFATAVLKESDGPIFVAIALVESKGETTAVNTRNSNGTKDYGLWQINSVHKELLDTYQPWSDPDKNFSMAASLYQGRGGKFTDWSTFNSGLYATRLAEATAAWGNPDMSATTTNAVSDTVNTAAAGITSVADFLSAITKASTWVRVGMGAAGVVLVLMVAAALARHHLPGPLGAVARAANVTPGA